MTDPSCIAFLDSGVGGLPYLEHVRKLLPDENFVYVADSENFPYGVKDSESLKNIVRNTVIKIINKLSPKMIVLACNTASVVALAALRSEFDIPFVGVVPAVKPAAELSASKRIGLLATNRTVQDKYVDWLIDSFASQCKVFKYPAADIVDFVENKYINSNNGGRIKIIKDFADKFKKDKIDALVLGCTHFIFIEDEIRSILDKTTNVIDSREGVARQVKRILEKENMLSEKHEENYLYNTGNSEILKTKFESFADKFVLKYSGSLD